MHSPPTTWRFVLALCGVLALAACSRAPSADLGTARESASRSEAAVRDKVKTVDAFDLKLGDCLNNPAQGDELGNVEVVACDQPHEMEVYALLRLPAEVKEPYPGGQAVSDFAANACRGGAFEDYVGTSKAESSLLAVEATPTRKSWRAGDREIVCLAQSDGEPLRESVRGSGR